MIMVGLEQICNIKIIAANTGLTIGMEIEWIALYCSAAVVGTTPSDTFLLLAAGEHLPCSSFDTMDETNESP